MDRSIDCFCLPKLLIEKKKRTEKMKPDFAVESLKEGLLFQITKDITIYDDVTSLTFFMRSKYVTSG